MYLSFRLPLSTSIWHKSTFTFVNKNRNGRWSELLFCSREIRRCSPTASAAAPKWRAGNITQTTGITDITEPGRSPSPLSLLVQFYRFDTILLLIVTKMWMCLQSLLVFTNVKWKLHAILLFFKSLIKNHLFIHFLYLLHPELTVTGVCIYFVSSKSWSNKVPGEFCIFAILVF